ncbi:hypothetical protein IPF86_01990 [Candidatus Nomurabacteria bacterium]|nr:MAG: hypothetical protein IPF86_01990 [Candidatus Nomurabacteria bacterium]
MKNKILVGALALTIMFAGTQAFAATITPADLSNRIESMYSRMATVMDRFDDLITRAQASGRDVTQAQNLLQTAVAKRATLKADIDTLKAMFGTATAFTPEMRAQVIKVKNDFIDLKQTVATVRDYLKTALEAYRASNPVTVE